MKMYFLKLVSYNAWANQKICEFIKSAGEEISILPQQSSFSTIKATLYHIWDAEAIWMYRLQGTSVTDWPSKNFNGNTFEGAELMIKNSRDFVTMVEKLEPADFSKKIQYKNLKGDTFENTTEDILAHVMNHSTFHRGQLITMLRVAGFTSLQSTDLIQFLREGTH